MPVGNLGPEEVVTASPDDDLGEIARKFDEENVGSIVITEDDAPVGMITDRDVALQVHQQDDVASIPVEDVMAEDPATIREDQESIEIARAINEHNVRRFPIVDEDGNLTGIATLDDLVATIGEELDSVSDAIEAQSPQYSR